MLSITVLKVTLYGKINVYNINITLLKNPEKLRYKKFLHEFPLKYGLKVEFIACSSD